MKQQTTQLKDVIHFYLPYDLELNLFERNYTLTGLAGNTFYTQQGAVLNYSGNDSEIKPLLRPLSDLKDDDFKEMDIYPKWYGLKDYLSDYRKMEFKHIEYLITSHFDVFGLIESNQAIIKQ